MENNYLPSEKYNYSFALASIIIAEPRLIYKFHKVLSFKDDSNTQGRG
jgi:hypothetical protein